MRLLIADDNAEMRALLRRVCAPIATEIRDCADGCAAVEAFAEFNPDWTIMDIGMPGMDGLAATRRIVAAHPGARVLMCTQHRTPEYEAAAREAGAVAILLKENLQRLPEFLARTCA